MVYRAVLVGCGAMSKGWLEALTSTPLKDRVRVVGLVDIDQNAAGQRKSDFDLDAEVDTDLAALLDKAKPDMVFDVVIPAARHQVVKIALERGCHVLSEKPMASALEDARDMVAMASRANRVHAVMQNRRYNEGIRRIRATIESGVLGDLTALHADFFVAPHFGGFREKMRNVLLLDMAIHTLDAGRYLSGKTPLSVYCHESNPKGSWWAHGATANAIFGMSDDVVFTYRGSWAAEGRRTSWDSEWRVVGSRGMLLWDGHTGFYAAVTSGDDGFLRQIEQIPLPPPGNWAETHGHRSVLSAFLDAIDEGREPETAGSDNIRSLSMVFAAIESARLGTPVAIPSD